MLLTLHAKGSTYVQLQIENILGENYVCIEHMQFFPYHYSLRQCNYSYLIDIEFSIIVT